MGKNNRIEFNDFDGDEKSKSIKAEEVFRNDEDIDSNVLDVDDLLQEEPVADYKQIRPKKSLFEDVEYGEDFSELNRILGKDEEPQASEPEKETYGDVFINYDDEEDRWKDDEFSDRPVRNKRNADGTKIVGSEDIVTADFDDDEDDIFNPRNKREKKKIQKRTIIVLCSVFGALALIVTVLLIIVFNIANQDTVYSGISLYGKDLGGMTQKEVAAYIDEMYIQPIKKADVTVVLNGEEFTYPMTDFIECPNAVDKAKEAYDIKREGGFFTRFMNILRLKQNGQEISLIYNFIDTSLDKVMNSAESESFSDPVDPTYMVKTDSEGKKTLYFVPGATGTKIDKRAFEKELLSALSAYEQEMSNLGSGESLKNIRIEAVVTTVKFIPLDADKILKEMLEKKESRKPVDAHYTKPNGEVIAVEAVSGIGPDEDRLIEVVAAINNGEVTAFEEVPFVTLWANVSKADLEAALFKKEVSAGYVTNTVDVADDEDETVDDTALRAENLSIIASKLDGYQVLDGETINFNDIIGSITSGRGYVYARENISGGGRILGGGVSMAATALYSAAAKYTGVSVSEISHSEYLPYFGERAFDAYVNASLGKNLIIRNTSGNPLKISASFDGEGFYVAIYGSKYDNHEKKSLSADLVSEETDGNYITYTYKVNSGTSLLDTSVVYKEVVNGNAGNTETPSEAPTGTPETTLDPDNTQNPDSTQDPDVTTDPSATPGGENASTPDPTGTPDSTVTEEPTETVSPSPTTTAPPENNVSE